MLVFWKILLMYEITEPFPKILSLKILVLLYNSQQTGIASKFPF